MTQPPWGNPPSRQATWPQQGGWPQQQAPWPTPQQQWSQQTQWPQQPQRWPQQWPPPPPPRRGPSLIGIVFQLALVVVGLVFLAALLNGFGSGRTLPTGGSGTGTGQGTVPYVNEQYSPPPPDLNPPGIPGPRDLAAAGRLVEQNPLYRERVPVPTRCDLAPVDGTNATRAQLETHLNDLMGCLMTVWDGPVSDAGFTLPRPPVVVYDQPVRTACGSLDDLNAAYCAGDQHIYYARSLLRSFPPVIRQSPYAVEMIVAHEFGHAIQARTAIIASERRLEQQASTQSAALELTRRTEVQADCLAGQFVRSVAQSQRLGSAELASLGRFTHALGDDVLSGRPGWSEGHGLGSSRQAWFERGMGSDSIGTCNTFTAPSDQVR